MIQSFTSSFPRCPIEDSPITFDYSTRLVAGETISTAEITIVVTNGTHANPSEMLIGGEVIDGMLVSQRIRGGKSGVDYLLHCTITTNAGNTRVDTASLNVYCKIHPG